MDDYGGPTGKVESAWGSGEDDGVFASMAETSLMRTINTLERALFDMMYALVKENELYKVRHWS